MLKIKFFTCLVLSDWFNTRNILRRCNKYLEEGYNCVMCQDGVEETAMHLFFECSSNVTRWFIVMIAAWCIWKPPSVAAWKSLFTSEVKLHLFHLSASLHLVVMNWLGIL